MHIQLPSSTCTCVCNFNKVWQMTRTTTTTYYVHKTCWSAAKSGHTHKQTHVHVYTSTYLCVWVLTILCCCLISCFSLRCSCCCCFCCCGRDYATYEHKALDNWIKTFVAPLRSQFQENFLYTVTATAAAAAHSGNFCNFSWLLLLLLGFLLGWQMAQRRRHGIDNKTNTYIHIHNTITITTRQGMNA